MLVLLYCMILFSDYVPDPEARNFCGFAYIGLVSIFAGVHLSILLGGMVCDLVTKIRRKYILYKNKKAFEKKKKE